MTAPDPAGTPDSRSGTVTAGQALNGILFNRAWTIGRWETLAEGDRAEMESMAAEFTAAIAAAAPAPAGVCPDCGMRGGPYCEDGSYEPFVASSGEIDLYDVPIVRSGKPEIRTTAPQAAPGADAP